MPLRQQPDRNWTKRVHCTPRRARSNVHVAGVAWGGEGGGGGGGTWPCKPEAKARTPFSPRALSLRLRPCSLPCAATASLMARSAASASSSGRPAEQHPGRLQGPQLTSLEEVWQKGLF